MNILVIGGGGREHAIAWRLAQEPQVKVWASPGNPGMARIATCITAPGGNHLALAQSTKADLVIVGPEAPLVAGVADNLRGAGIPVVGPSKAAASLEASKVFAKTVMVQAGVPTAGYRNTASLEEAMRALDGFSFPVVLKADGLAAGKGVITAHDQEQAGRAVRHLVSTMGPNLVIEEFLEGEEASFIVLCDGNRAIPLEASQDHKTIFDGDQGPNTGGMGAYCDGRILTTEEANEVMGRVIQPTLDYMLSRGTPFSGFLYAGLMMTAAGPKVLEFNVRLGDPEAQSLLHRIEGGFLDALCASAAGDLGPSTLNWRPEPSVCVVIASAGYPDQPRVGDIITGLAAAEETGATLFHAGTRFGTGGSIETAGGRVLGVTARGADLQAAIANTYEAVDRIHFEGMQVRRDIGRKGLKRW